MDTLFTSPDQAAPWAIPAHSTELPSGPEKKKRAPAACSSCRARKVRCDVEGGMPCTNCNFTGAFCVVPAKRNRRSMYIRERKPKSGHKNDPRKSSQKDKAETSRQQHSRPLVVEDEKQMGARHSESNSELLHPDRLSAMHRSSPPSVWSHDEEPQISPWGIEEHISLLASAPYAAAERQLQKWRSMNTPTVAFTKPSLPSYIRDPPASICTRGADYLTRMGCFSLPPPRLRNELMASYLGFMHHKLPLFDLPRFCTSMHRYDGSSQLSLIIFQAIMFAGAAFVDMSYLQNAGYSSRAEARKALYQRTRLLYDYRYESDVVTVLHALLIVTHSAAQVGMDLPTQRAPTPTQVPPPPGPGPPGAVYVPFASQPDEPFSDTQSTLSGMTREGEMGFGTVASNPVQYVAPGGAFPGQRIPHMFPTPP